MPNGTGPTSSTRRIWLARGIAAAADLLQIAVFPVFSPGLASPLDAGLDVAVAVLMVLLVGWHVAFIPTFIIEGASVRRSGPDVDGGRADRRRWPGSGRWRWIALGAGVAREGEQGGRQPVAGVVRRAQQARMDALTPRDRRDLDCPVPGDRRHVRVRVRPDGSGRSPVPGGTAVRHQPRGEPQLHADPVPAQEASNWRRPTS
jgi:hypothetical protein